MQKAILIALQNQNQTDREAENSLDELERLCQTRGMGIVFKMSQKRNAPDPAYFVGRGKIEEIKGLILRLGAQTIVFDDALKPMQQRNLEKALDVKVLDRTRIILDIFAMRAHSKEGKLQVERANLGYLLSRLANFGTSLDSQTGGIGTRRGPGEKKLEDDKRKIRDKIAALDRQIVKIKENRQIQRRLREKQDLPEIAIAGYTNAGKSTLLKALSKSAVYADDKLFATLNPLTRKVKLPNLRTVLFTDTVGFINKLPHDLVEAFKSTMEEILRASAIVHVIDASSPDRQKQIETVHAVLRDIGANHIPLIAVYNKADKVDDFWKKAFSANGACVASAKDGKGLDKILKVIQETIEPKHFKRSIKIGYENQKVLNEVRKLSNIKSQKYNKRNIALSLECSDINWSKIKKVLGANYV
jgi:GTP-binding protein HflX